MLKNELKLVVYQAFSQRLKDAIPKRISFVIGLHQQHSIKSIFAEFATVKP